MQTAGKGVQCSDEHDATADGIVHRATMVANTSDGFRARAAQCSPQMGESGGLATPSVALHNKTHQDSVT